jgi:hypothetical protein
MQQQAPASGGALPDQANNRPDYQQTNHYADNLLPF